jgi:hypothetical protein
MPGGTYAIGFLRTYAEYLGLDGEKWSAASGQAAGRCRRAPSCLPSRSPRAGSLGGILFVGMSSLPSFAWYMLARGPRSPKFPCLDRVSSCSSALATRLPTSWAPTARRRRQAGRGRRQAGRGAKTEVVAAEGEGQGCPGAAAGRGRHCRWRPAEPPKIEAAKPAPQDRAAGRPNPKTGRPADPPRPRRLAADSEDRAVRRHCRTVGWSRQGFQRLPGQPAGDQRDCWVQVGHAFQNCFAAARSLAFPPARAAGGWQRRRWRSVDGKLSAAVAPPARSSATSCSIPASRRDRVGRDRRLRSPTGSDRSFLRDRTRADDGVICRAGPRPAGCRRDVGLAHRIGRSRPSSAATAMMALLAFLGQLGCLFLCFCGCSYLCR